MAATTAPTPAHLRDMADSYLRDVDFLLKRDDVSGSLRYRLETCRKEFESVIERATEIEKRDAVRGPGAGRNWEAASDLNHFHLRPAILDLMRLTEEYQRERLVR